MRICLNSFWSCYCGKYNAIKFKDCVCDTCLTNVRLNRTNSFSRIFVKSIPKPLLKLFTFIVFKPSPYNTNFMKNGKGSARRPMKVTIKDFSQDWDRVFGPRPTKNIVEPPPAEPIQNQLKNSSAVATD